MPARSRDIKGALGLNSEWVLSCGARGKRLVLPMRCNLRGLDLREANMSHADLRGVDLRGANMSHADLRHADLSYADLRDADLSYADLRDADLRWAKGNDREVISICVRRHHVVYTATLLSIGCQTHPIEDWWCFSDEEIAGMSPDALNLWSVHKAPLRALIDANPAVASN